MQEGPLDTTKRSLTDERQMTSAADSLYGAVCTQTVISQAVSTVIPSTYAIVHNVRAASHVA